MVPPLPYLPLFTLGDDFLEPPGPDHKSLHAQYLAVNLSLAELHLCLALKDFHLAYIFADSPY